MKKTLLATALLAGFAGTAYAQSSVTLYGIVDVGIGGSKIHDQDRTFGMESGVQSGSRWGLRGSEDLGGGLRANFKLESGFDTTTGRSGQGGRMFGREAWAGLSGNFGEVRLGRQEAAQYQALGFISPFGDGFGQAGIGNAFNGVSTNRADNTIAYFSPNFSGFQASVGYSFNYDGGSAANDDSNQLWSVGLKYANGPFAVGLGYEGTKLGDNTTWHTAQNGKDPHNYTLGGTWDFNVVKAYAAASYTKHGYVTDATSVAPGENIKSYLVGLSAPVGAGSLFGSWQHSNYSGDVGPNGDDKRNIYSVGYTYNMSKRTNLYAYYAYSDTAFFDEDWDRSSYAVGLRHRF